MNTTLIMKATRLCNLRCEYCHDWRVGRDQTMSFDTLARVTHAAMTDPDHDGVEFIWHGGEPTLLGTAWFERALQLQARWRRPGQHVKNTMQTNATRIDDEWISFWRRYDIGLGLSLDGPESVHGSSRPYATGRSSYDDVRAGIERLRASAISPSILMVVDRPVLDLGPDAVFDFFLELGIRSYGLLAAKPDNQPDAVHCTPTEHYVDPVEFNEFLTRIHDRWVANGDPSLSIRELDSIRSRLAGGGRECVLSEQNCVGSYFLVEPDGTIAHCDLFDGDDEYTFGNLRTDSFQDLRASAAMAVVSDRNDAEVDAMRGCPEFEVCQGWCPHERYISRRHNPHHSDDCCGLRPLIEHVRAHPLDDAHTPVAPPPPSTPVPTPRRRRPTVPAA